MPINSPNTNRRTGHARALLQPKEGLQMTFVELPQRYLAKCEALRGAHPTDEGTVHKAWLRSLDRLSDRPPVLRTKADALAAVEFLQEGIGDSGATNLEPLVKRLRDYLAEEVRS